MIENPELFENIETTKRSKFKKHTSKTLEEAIKLKKDLKKKAEAKNATEEDRKRFRQALRAINDLNHTTPRNFVFEK